MFDIYVKSYDEILTMVSEEELALKYLGMRVGKFHKSLFRKDPNPSATLYRNNKGRLQYNDFCISLQSSLCNYDSQRME